MTEWWKRNNIAIKNSKLEILGSTDDQIKLYTKAEVEDFTGCIPLLLDKCVRCGKIDPRFEDFYDIIDKARGFVQAMRDKHESAWKQYVEYCSPSGT